MKGKWLLAGTEDGLAGSAAATQKAGKGDPGSGRTLAQCRAHTVRSPSASIRPRDRNPPVPGHPEEETMTMIRTLTAAATAATLLATAGWSQQATTNDPADFAQMAGVSNMFEIESSRLVLDRQLDDVEVTDFARRMIEDHTMAGEQMMAAAAEEGVNVPTMLDDEHQAKLQQLQQAEGDAFGQAYIQAQVEAHEKAVTLFEGFSQQGQEGPLRNFAAETLPKLQEHEQSIRAIANQPAQ
ncbi:DUF4142 domain-containing protein [Cereibacter sphaeroides]|nr:DUF4142 domain-containing protein [Cereibacter sphaeroides]